QRQQDHHRVGVGPQHRVAQRDAVVEGPEGDRRIQDQPEGQCSTIGGRHRGSATEFERSDRQPQLTTSAMGMPAAKSGDKVVALDRPIVMVPSPGGPVPPPLPHPFNGVLTTSLSANVMIGGMPAATVGSMATNMPIHFPTPPGTMFQKPPSNQAT